MNARVLELIQRPENISAEDISVLQSEIDKFPYMQSIRTLGHMRFSMYLLCWEACATLL